MKEKFEKAEIKVVEFETEDVITTSGITFGDEDETEGINPF